MPIKLVIGLRNPGAAYQDTRHNAGEWFVLAWAKQFDTAFKIDKKLHGELNTIENNNFSCKVILPLTFMNQSGLPTRTAAQFYQIHPSEILVIHDDLDLPAGRIKLKTGGGHGGHNGLRDIISQLGSAEFHRLRVGIDHPGQKELVLNYVLGKPTQFERQKVFEAIDRGIGVMPKILAGDFANAMNLLN